MFYFTNFILFFFPVLLFCLHFRTLESSTSSSQLCSATMRVLFGLQLETVFYLLFKNVLFCFVFILFVPLWGGCFLSTISQLLRLRLCMVSFLTIDVCFHVLKPHDYIPHLCSARHKAKPCILFRYDVIGCLPEIFLSCLYNMLLSLISTIHLDISKLLKYQDSFLLVG